MILVSQNIYVTGNGDTWIWPITVTNNSAVSATSVEVVNTFNTGFTVDVATPSQGSYDMGLGIWTIGTMAPGATVTLNLECTVTDINSAPFTISSTVSSFGTESTPLDNEATSTVRALCASFASCFVNSTMHQIDSPGESEPATMLTYIQGEVVSPSCGDVAVVGGDCTDSWVSMYDCTTSDWTLPILISKPTHFANILYVDNSVYANDSLAQVGSTTCVFETIQGALDAASAGDTIKVMPGVYTLTAPLDLGALSGALTLDVSPGAFIKGPNGDFTITDSGTYIGKFTIAGGGTIQGNNADGIISITNTDPTSKLFISDINIVNIEGKGLVTEVDTYLSNVGIYDTDISNYSIESTGASEIQCRNVFANTAEEGTANITIQAITVDSHLVLNYV